MTVLFLFFIIPLSVLLFLEIKEVNRRIDFTQKERMGAEVNRSLRRLMEHLLHHRGMMVAYLTGDISSKTDIKNEHYLIATEIEAVDSLSKRYGTSLKIEARWEDFKKEWHKLEFTENTLTIEESFGALTELIDNTIELISYIGETSNLILDPNITTHALTDSITIHLPRLVDSLGQTSILGVLGSISRKITPDNKRLTVLTGSIMYSMDETEAMVKRAILSEPGIIVPLEVAVNELDTKIKKFLGTIDNMIVDVPEIKVKEGAYYRDATEALNAAFKLYDVVYPALDNLLKERISGYQAEKNILIAISLCIFAIFLYLFTALARNTVSLGATRDHLRHQLEFEKLVASISTRFVNTSNGDTISLMSEALQKIGEFVHADTCYASLFSSDGLMIDTFCEWCSEGIMPHKDLYSQLSVDRLPWAIRKLKSFESLNIQSVKDLPPEAWAEKAVLQATGVNSMLIIPLGYHGTAIGFLGLNSIRIERKWTEQDISLLKIVGEFFVSIFQREKAEAALERLSVTDHLTQIFNRLKFENVLEKEIQRARRHNRTFSLIMFDIDHFKKINDFFGHEAGDNVLRKLTQTVSVHIRAIDMFARWGGEEFIILVVETHVGDARSFAEKLRREIESTSFYSGSLTCSFGVTESCKTDDTSTIIKRADAALYDAKRNGRNLVCIR
jgi:diguanylate cyclase (GGDEF)-like protein